MQTDQSKIRNFSIIAHIDHGKSTLADRMLEKTNTDLHRDKRKDRVLDRLDLEQEKGITIKLQAVRMYWKDYMLNLIDTPGHVDFSYEVSRSLAACEAAILLVDAQQGIQAQTISNAQKALELGIQIIPVINKIDIPGIKIDHIISEMVAIFNVKEEDIVKVSAKTGEGVELLLDEIVAKCPPPIGEENAPLKALIFDSYYDEHKGVVIAVRVFQGMLKLKSGETVLHILQREEQFKPTEIGFFNPVMQEMTTIYTGEVGYIATGLKDIRYFTVGDTVSDTPNIEPLPGYKVPQPNVFATFFPTDSEAYESLKIALNKLALNDASLTFADQKSNLLGSGFRCGFLGLLHMEIVQERLEREFDVDLVITAPTVEYKVKLTSGEEITVQTPQELPDPTVIEEIQEPWARLELMTPKEYMGALMDLTQKRRGVFVNTKYLGGDQPSDVLTEKYIILEYDIPLASLVSNFFDQMKNITHGYASMQYDLIDFFPVELVKVTVMVNKVEVGALSFLETKEGARPKAAKLLEVMKEVIPRQQFMIPLQAAVGAKIIARENVNAFRKDVTAKLYGGDYSRKKKLLEKQKKGKKRLKQIGNVNIPQEAFLAILKT